MLDSNSFDEQTLIRELTKLSVKMDVLCSELNELKEFNKSAVQRITILEERVRTLEEWKDEMTRYQRLKIRVGYDLRSAIAGGATGGLIGLVGGILIKIIWG